jgi:hypothetical protein
LTKGFFDGRWGAGGVEPSEVVIGSETDRGPERVMVNALAPKAAWLCDGHGRQT